MIGEGPGDDIAGRGFAGKDLINLWETSTTHWMILSGREVRRQASQDGTTKLLLEWPDGGSSECVLIPDEKRRTACISTQVGCAVGCTFCMTGTMGLARQLTVGEIVDQVHRADRRLVELVDRPRHPVTRSGLPRRRSRR